MKAAKYFLMFFMFPAITVLIFMSFFIPQENRNEQAKRIQQRQKERQEVMKRMCDRESDFLVRRTKYDLNNMTEAMFDNLVVDDTHRIIYCYVPKVACTHWKRIMFALKKGKPYSNLTSIDPAVVHDNGQLKYLRNMDKHLRTEKIKNYTKFLFVRDPFVRVVSAFRDKFHYKPEHEGFYRYYGKEMLKRYGNRPNPPKTMREADRLGVLPAFEHFVKYLVDPRTEKRAPFQPHWRQMHRLCHPCLIKYDFIGHLETLQEDASELLKILKLDKDIKFPPSTNENKTTSDTVLDLFHTVTLEDRRKLYKVFEWDFKLFGYERPSKWLDG